MMEAALHLFIFVNVFFWSIVAAVIITGVMILFPIYFVIGLCKMCRGDFV